MIFFSLILFLITAPPSIEWTGSASGGIIAVECAGDINSDGTDDIFAASVEDQGYGIMCIDGISGDVIWTNEKVPGAFNTDCLRAIGDADLDGIADLAVGTWMNYAVTVLSGSTGSVIWTDRQTLPVHFVESVDGPDTGGIAVIATKVEAPNHYCSNIAFDGQTGDVLWATPATSTLDYWIRTTDSDVSGNGWSEMGYSIDRGSVMNGYVVVRDGYTGDVLQSAGTMYFGTMDICSYYSGLLAVSNFGDYPVMWVESIISGTAIWSSNDWNLEFSTLDFIPNITGSYSPYPEILGWSGSHLTLIRGDDGYYQDEYIFPSEITSVDCYLDEEFWKLALITSGKFYCPELVFDSPSTEPSIVLPNSGGTDLCLLESDEYPTPLVAVSMTGSGPGVCVISTSWPVEIAEESNDPGSVIPSVRLLSIPGRGGLTIIGESQVEVMILDIAGRIIEIENIAEGEQVHVQLFPGVYQLVDSDSGRLLYTATVLCE